MIQSPVECGLTVRCQCGLLQVPRWTYYYRQKSAANRLEGEGWDQGLKERIEAVVLEYPRYGYRRVSRELRNRYPNQNPSNHKGLLCQQKPRARPYSPASQPSPIPNLMVTAPN